MKNITKTYMAIALCVSACQSSPSEIDTLAREARQTNAKVVQASVQDMATRSGYTEIINQQPRPSWQALWQIYQATQQDEYYTQSPNYIEFRQHLGAGLVRFTDLTQDQSPQAALVRQKCMADMLAAPKYHDSEAAYRLLQALTTEVGKDKVHQWAQHIVGLYPDHEEVMKKDLQQIDDLPKTARYAMHKKRLQEQYSEMHRYFNLLAQL